MNSVHPPPETLSFSHVGDADMGPGETLVKQQDALLEHLYGVTGQHKSPYSLLVANVNLTPIRHAWTPWCVKAYTKIYIHTVEYYSAIKKE